MFFAWKNSTGSTLSIWEFSAAVWASLAERFREREKQRHHSDNQRNVAVEVAQAAVILAMLVVLDLVFDFTAGPHAHRGSWLSPVKAKRRCSGSGTGASGREQPQAKELRARVRAPVHLGAAGPHRPPYRFAWSTGDAWPSSSWMARRSPPRVRRCVAKEWRRACGVAVSGRLRAPRNRSMTSWMMRGDSGPPRAPTNNGLSVRQIVGTQRGVLLDQRQHLRQYRAPSASCCPCQ